MKTVIQVNVNWIDSVWVDIKFVCSIFLNLHTLYSLSFSMMASSSPASKGPPFLNLSQIKEKPKFYAVHVSLFVWSTDFVLLTSHILYLCGKLITWIDLIVIWKHKCQLYVFVYCKNSLTLFFFSFFLSNQPWFTNVQIMIFRFCLNQSFCINSNFYFQWTQF